MNIMALCLCAALHCLFPAGTRENPSVVAPIEPQGEPVAFWWDEEAFHAGDKSYPWKKLKTAPVDGKKFHVDLGTSRQRRRIILEGTLDSTAPRLRLGAFGEIGGMHVSNRVEATASEAGPLFGILYMTGMTLDYAKTRKTATMKKGERVGLDFTADCPESGYFTFQLWNGKKMLYDCNGYVHAPSLRFNFRYLWTEPERMLMHVNAERWTDDADRYSMRVSMKDLLSGTLGNWTKTLKIDAGWGEKDFQVDVSDLPSGMYDAHVEFIDRDGSVVRSAHANYMKPDAKMPWQGNALGMEDTVPPPWTKPDFGTDGIFTCWNRTVRLGGEGLVSSIQNGGKELLAAPVALVADGQTLAFDATLAERKNSEATYRLVSRHGGVVAKVKCEFDGFMLFEVTYPSEMKSLEWKVAVDRTHVTGFNDCSSEFNDKAIFRKGSNPGWSYDPSKLPMWWMPGRIGLMGGFPTMRGWNVRDIANAVRVSSSANDITLSATIVDEPATNGARTALFYLEPTPVKPKNNVIACEDPANVITWTGHIGRYFETKYPGLQDTVACDKFASLLDRGKRVLFYNASDGASILDPLWSWYGRDWALFAVNWYAHEMPLKDRRRWDKAYWTYACLNNRDFLDYKVWSVNWYMHNYVPAMKDLYFDLAGQEYCRNSHHDCVWKDSFGRTMHDWSILSKRELHKRVYRLVKAKNADGVMDGHITNSRSPADVFFDLIRVGEPFAGKIAGNNYTYYDLFTPDVMQSAFVPKSQEFVTTCIPQFLRAREIHDPALAKTYDWKENDRAIRHFAAYVKMHDMRTNRMPGEKLGPQLHTVDMAVASIGPQRTYDAYHLDATTVQVSNPHPRFLWAWFANGRKGMLILLNDTDDEMTQTVMVKGLSSIGKELLDGDNYDFSSGRCEMRFPSRGAKFIRFGYQ